MLMDGCFALMLRESIVYRSIPVLTSEAAPGVVLASGGYRTFYFCLVIKAIQLHTVCIFIILRFNFEFFTFLIKKGCLFVN
jgi:hypothetical protein